MGPFRVNNDFGRHLGRHLVFDELSRMPEWHRLVL